MAQSCLTLCDPMDYSPPGSSVHGIFQTRVLKCAAISCSRASSWPRCQTSVICVSCIGRQILYEYATWKPEKPYSAYNEQSTNYDLLRRATVENPNQCFLYLKSSRIKQTLKTETSLFGACMYTSDSKGIHVLLHACSEPRPPQVETGHQREPAIKSTKLKAITPTWVKL